MKREELRLEILKLAYVKGTSIETNLATVRMIEKELFDEPQEVELAEEAPAVKRGRPPKSKVADNSTESLLQNRQDTSERRSACSAIEHEAGP